MIQKHATDYLFGSNKPPVSPPYDIVSRLERPPGGFGAPSGPPPTAIPERGAVQPFAVDPGAVRFCLYKFTYIWPRRGRPFWFYPIFLGRRSVAGFRWTGNRWFYYGMDLREIQSFKC